MAQADLQGAQGATREPVLTPSQVAPITAIISAGDSCGAFRVYHQRDQILLRHLGTSDCRPCLEDRCGGGHLRQGFRRAKVFGEVVVREMALSIKLIERSRNQPQSCGNDWIFSRQSLVRRLHGGLSHCAVIIGSTELRSECCITPIGNRLGNQQVEDSVVGRGYGPPKARLCWGLRVDKYERLFHEIVMVCHLSCPFWILPALVFRIAPEVEVRVQPPILHRSQLVEQERGNPPRDVR